MQKTLILSFLVLASCASKPVSYPVKAPAGAMTLETALHQTPEETTAYLKEHVSGIELYDVSNSADPASHLPDSLRASKTPALPKEKSLTQGFIRKYRVWTAERRAHQSEKVLSTFTCEHAPEAQALGFTLEIDFPAETATTLSQQLHEKVISCDYAAKAESYFRLAIFSIQKKDCARAMGYLKDFPPAERGTSDRLAYVKSFCVGTSEVSQRNPWSGYGILLKDASNENRVPAAWYLTTQSGSEDWDRLLATFVDLNLKGKKGTVQYIASKLNYEALRSLPHSFQASVFIMMTYAGADLAVFQTLHRYIADHPEMVSPDVTTLLFPTRYWNEIVENSHDMDPILVKALIRQESAFNPQARSRAKASGLMQLIYPTARRFGVPRPSLLLKPDQNIQAGSQFLGQLIEEFGSVELALAAYNAGPGIVRKWQKRYPTDNIELFVEMIPYSETREYVRLVRRNFRVYETLLSRPQLLGETRGDIRLPASTP